MENSVSDAFPTGWWFSTTLLLTKVHEISRLHLARHLLPWTPEPAMKRTLLAILLTGAAMLPLPAQQQQQQQQQPQQQDEGDAPDHGVARISLVNGDVSVRHGDSGDLTAAAPNGPLIGSDFFSAKGPNSTAEIQFDAANMIRLDQSSEVRMGELEYGRYLVQIATGTTTFRVLRNSSADIEISTPTVSVRADGAVEFTGDGAARWTTEITVRTGGPRSSYSAGAGRLLNAGTTLQARGTARDPEYMIDAANLGHGHWDRWNADRDRDLERAGQLPSRRPESFGQP